MKIFSRPNFALLGAFLIVSTPWAAASSVTLDFTSAGGTVLDASGNGTGFTARLSGTDADSPDSRLVLNTGGAGTLGITGNASGTDFNGQSHITEQEAPGIKLSTLGFTGAQDFSLTATFINVPAAAFQDFSQLGVYVGTASNNLTRDGFVYASGAGGPNYFTNVNTGGDASNIMAAPAFVPGSDLTVSISRTAGVFTETINGNTIAPPSDPQLLFTGATDLTVGVFMANTTAGDSFTATLDSFSATVAPEPGTWMLFGVGLLVLLFRCSRRAIV